MSFICKLEDFPNDDFFQARLGKRVVATNGCFDILHVGHSRYLQESKSFGDILVVGLNSDKSVKNIKGQDRPINSQEDRAELLLALESVDWVVIFDEDNAVNFLKTIKPEIYTKGGDYSLDDLKKWPEYSVAKEIECKIELVSFVNGKSSSNIIKKLS